MTADALPPIEQLHDQLRAFMDAHIYPNESRYHEELNALPDRFATVPLMETLKARAREAGLWNLWLPADHGGLSNLDYCRLAEEMGRVLWSPEAFNCNAPDTGNMEVFLKYGSAAQKAEWLEPLLNGEIRSSYCMTEPDVASSDATNIRTSIRRDGSEYVINGRKWFITNAPYERTRIFIVMGLSDPENPNRHLRQSQVLVPKHTPGVTIVRPLTTLGYDDAPLGHAEVLFDDVRVPAANMLLGEGRGFEISQVRLGPGRIHHCMRSIGAAEKALELMVRRGLSREAFGKPIARLGKNPEVIAKARIEIEAMRLMVLRGAKA
ncbi:MAG: acyl-CoA dehydrogenase family protein, partial [Gammaproteobacteria bacterium]